MNVELAEPSLTAAASAAATAQRRSQLEMAPAFEEGIVEKQDFPASGADERLPPLFGPDAATSFRAQWDAVQIGFVDDPKQAVRKADELVAQVMKSPGGNLFQRAHRAREPGRVD